jgi:HTH-type transcriptional regulator/antitoxin HigA
MSKNRSSIYKKNMSQKQLATKIGISPLCISDYVSGRAEPTLKIARLLRMTLGISPAAMLVNIITSSVFDQ